MTLKHMGESSELEKSIESEHNKIRGLHMPGGAMSIYRNTDRVQQRLLENILGAVNKVFSNADFKMEEIVSLSC